MKTLITGIKRLALALCFATPLVSWAETKTNPVTGETETYANVFTGETEWNAAGNWTPEGVPYVSGGIYSSALVSNKTVSTETSIDGWNLQVGAYNGASITWSTLGKIQGDTGMWLTVDGTSSITINSWGGGHLGDNQALNYYVASENGVTWASDLSECGNETLTMNYYLAGAGSVSYAALERGTHVIKQADVTLSGTKEVKNKTLVSFESTTKTFTADAAIKIKNGDNVLKTVYLTSVTASDTTLTTEDAVGTCELVQKSDGVYLYYVDGDPADVVVEEKTYKPSININFTHSGNGLTTQADVGLTGYEVPGTSWNNFAGANATYSTVNAVDATGAASVLSGVSVTVSGTRGSYSCSGVAATSNPLNGYIDENAGNMTPTVTVTGIPYYKYRVIVYHSTDTADVPFGYDTINGTNYTYVNDALTEGTTAWGASGAANSANAISAGGNTLVTGELSGSTLTVVGHREGGASNARGCISAIQIVEVKPDAGENDFVIKVSGDTVYTVSETKELSGTVYITGYGTLTLDGEANISAATIEVSDGVVLNVNADRLDGTTFTGAGTVVYDGAVPPTDKGWTDSAWTGTVWIKNKSGITGNNVVATSVKPNSLGNSLSKVKFSGVNGWIEAPVTYDPEIVLENAGYDYALKLMDGSSPNSQSEANYNRATTIKKLSGSGTLCCGGTSTAAPTLKVYDASGFTGSINTVNADGAAKTGLVVVFCDENTELPDTLVNLFINTNLKRTIYVASGKTVTLGSAATWTAATGFVVEGTLIANGTLASSASAAVTGAGTVVFNGKLPSPTGDAWWKNSDWDGTVQLKSVAFTGVAGVDTYLDVNKYGNSDSVLELNNCSGWLPVGDTAGDNVCTVPLKVTGTLTINNGYSSRTFKINKLLGNGTIYTTSNTATTTIQVLSADDFSGYVKLESKRVIFGETVPATFTEGQIYVGSGFSLTVPNSDVAWYGAGGITVDGELKAAALSNFGGGTTITTTDNGVFTFITNSNSDDMDTDYTRLKGTGTLKLEGSAYRCISTNNFPTAMTVDNRLTAGFLHRISGLEITIGSLAGDGYLRSDWGGSAGDRNLKVLQAKDTTWSGRFWTANPHRFDSLIVAPGDTTAGTLTLSATHEAAESTGLTVESGAKVNLTGTWVGATTVAGTFGGTGTLTGDLTLTDGATFKASATALTVSGTVTLPTAEEETLTIDASAIDVDEVTIISSESITAETDVSKVAVNGLYTVTPDAGALKLVTTKVEVTVPAILNTTVTVAVGGETIGTEAGSYKVAPDSVVTVTYAAAAGYKISGTGTTEYTIDTSKSETTFEPQTTVEQYVAKIVDGASYTSLQAAFDAVVNNNRIVLLASTEDGAVVPSTAMTFYFYAGEFECGTIADATGDFVTTRSDETIEINEEDVTATKIRVAAAVAVVTIPNEGATNYGDYMPAYNAFLAGPVGTTLRIIGNNPFSTEISCTTYDSDTQTYTKLEAVASITVGQITTNYASLDDACAAAEGYDPVPAVVLLVEKGEQTVPSGWQYNNAEASGTTYGTLTKVETTDYPSYITPANQAKYTEWAEYAEVSVAEAEELEEAYLLNCLPSEVEAAKAAFKITNFYQDSEGKWVVVTTTGYNNRTYNGTVTVTRYSDVACKTENATGTFFRASLD